MASGVLRVKEKYTEVVASLAPRPDGVAQRDT